MKQVLIKQGHAVVEDTPAPQNAPGMVLVQVEFSCISAGTEISGVRMSGGPLWKKIIRNPAKVAKVAQMLVTEGAQRTRRTVTNAIFNSNAGTPTGYSAAGRVLEVADNVNGISIGDRVACAGAQFAHHAEVISVPVNLTVPVPKGIEMSHASTVTLGAIAMQGVRRVQPTLGETFVVIGMGILGQITAQLLRINGCRVIGVDLIQDRIDLAQRLGMNFGLRPGDDDEMEQVKRLTDGIGADGAIITAATSSDSVISSAFQMCRKKGRVVLVGDVGLELKREDIYVKELDFFISTSYGPGRYDRNYEEEGLDYPVAYVRWTENRNMSEYLRLIADGRLLVEPLIDAMFPIDEAGKAYEALQVAEKRPLIVILNYPRSAEERISRRLPTPGVRQKTSNKIQIAVVGAGSFATEVHLPNIQQMSNQFSLRAVVNRTGHTAVTAAKRFGAAYASTDYEAVLSDPEVDAVLIATQHDLHSTMTLAALRADKHVLVEKPLSLNQTDINEIAAFFSTCEAEGRVAPILMTGFNRRFSPHAKFIAQIVEKRTNPMILNYRMNAGYVPLDNWVHGAHGGGRNLGEACHIYDLFTMLTKSKCVQVNTHWVVPATGYYSSQDNFVTVLSFEDGSVATLTYTALGSSSYPKERMEVFVDGKVIVLDNYQTVTVAGVKRAAGLETPTQDKGHFNELDAFAVAVHGAGKWPIPLWEQIQATEISLRVEEQLGK